MKSNTLLFITIFFYSCLNISEKEITVIPNENMKTVLDSFVISNPCDSCFFEIFIDKISPYDYDFIVTKGTQRFISSEDKYNKQKVFTVSYIKGVKFYIYSGVEHYFYLDSNQIVDVNDSKSDSNRSTWVISDSSGVYKTKGSDMAYPFIPSSYRNMIEYTPE